MKEWGVKETTTATGSSLMECQSHDIWPNVISSHIKLFKGIALEDDSLLDDLQSSLQKQEAKLIAFVRDFWFVG
ncbi:hypothetical protein JHK86_043801 [Glycine max]|nr:hypothetical protein JHK86_043801 [Glycine max]